MFESFMFVLTMTLIFCFASGIVKLIGRQIDFVVREVRERADQKWLIARKNEKRREIAAAIQNHQPRFASQLVREAKIEFGEIL